VHAVSAVEFLIVSSFWGIMKGGFWGGLDGNALLTVTPGPLTNSP